MTGINYDEMPEPGIGTSKKNPNGAGRAETPPSAKASDDNRDGAALLNEVLGFLQRFVAYPSPDAAIAHALWIAHTHLMDEWDSTPRLALLSPEPGSGKTRALEVSETLVPRPIASINATPAYLFRKVSDPDGRPTILYDEIDTLFGPKAKDHEEVRGLINAGHRQGATAGRCVVKGKVIETEELPAYCAVALAGLGDLPDTIITRSIVIRMRRRAPGEQIEAYRARLHRPEGEEIQGRLATWASTQTGIGDQYPAMPDGVTDRAADVWEPLLTVADAAGGAWPERARVTAVTLVTLSLAGTPSLGIRLLSDLRAIFGSRDLMFTKVIIEELSSIEEAPWGDIKGKPITDRLIARLLKAYQVESRPVRDGLVVLKGYHREDLHDTWIRYLGPAAISKVDTPLSPLGVPTNVEVTKVTNGTTPKESVTDADDYRRASRGE